jgi:NAD(P)-dependent dehydrogenase (short-subunit alcohol dehydrogenase family)
MASNTEIDRRQLLAGAAVAGTAASIATAACAAAEPNSLAGKSILISGCSSGFGYLGALHYAKLGARVIASMRNLPRPEADKLAVEGKGLDLHIIEIDVLSDDSVARGVAEAERIAGGALDVLVNNAGIGTGLPVEMQDMVATRLIFETNVFGYQRMARAVLPKMRAARRGQIFAVSSQLGRVIAPGYGLYSATKFAVEAQAEQMAYELAAHGIEVTIIEPGGYPTDIWRKSNDNTEALLARSGDALKAAYQGFVDSALQTGAGRDTDPMDIPRAIAGIIAMPTGRRPLRRPVHPNFIPQAEINRVSADTQRQFLGRSAFAPSVEAVLD